MDKFSQQRVHSNLQDVKNYCKNVNLNWKVTYDINRCTSKDKVKEFLVLLKTRSISNNIYNKYRQRTYLRVASKNCNNEFIWEIKPILMMASNIILVDI